MVLESHEILLGNNADADAKIVSLLFLRNVTVMLYSSTDAAVMLYNMVSNCCLSLRRGPGKCFSGPGKVLEFFVTKRVGTLG